MNTRLQVEHPITEMVTGIDRAVADPHRTGGAARYWPARSAKPNGHAIECRIYAEDPDAGFMPSPGRITALGVPGGPWIRDDSGAEPGTDVPIYYDPLISKLSAWGRPPEPLRRMKLRENHVGGIRTTVPFFDGCWSSRRSRKPHSTPHIWTSSCTTPRRAVRESTRGRRRDSPSRRRCRRSLWRRRSEQASCSARAGDLARSRGAAREEPDGGWRLEGLRG